MAARLSQRQVWVPVDVEALRETRAHTYRDLAPKVGVSPAALCLYNNGTRRIPHEVAGRLVRILLAGD
jgi:predicted transcriptional regulator